MIRTKSEVKLSKCYNPISNNKIKPISKLLAFRTFPYIEVYCGTGQRRPAIYSYEMHLWCPGDDTDQKWGTIAKDQNMEVSAVRLIR